MQSFSVEMLVRADTWTSWMMFYWVMPCPAHSCEYNEALAAVRVMCNESQFCITGAQLSALPGIIQDCTYEQCPGHSLGNLGWRWTACGLQVWCSAGKAESQSHWACKIVGGFSMLPPMLKLNFP
jgi:hypothetical protein